MGYYYNPFLPGQFSGLLRIHGFVWDSGRFTTLDFPLQNTFTLLRSINTAGEVIGEYFHIDPNANEIFTHKWFLYDSGNFILDFPESFEYTVPAGPVLTLADINDEGIILGRWENAGELDGTFLYKDGQSLYISPFPEEWKFVTVRGLNSQGQFVGQYAIEKPDFHFELHGFTASPGPTIKGRKKD